MLTVQLRPSIHRRLLERVVGLVVIKQKERRSNATNEKIKHARVQPFGKLYAGAAVDGTEVLTLNQHVTTPFRLSPVSPPNVEKIEYLIIG